MARYKAERTTCRDQLRPLQDPSFRRQSHPHPSILPALRFADTRCLYQTAVPCGGAIAGRARCLGRLAKAEGCMWACRIVSAGSCLPSRLPRAPRNPTGRSAGFLPLRGSLYIAFRFLLGAGGSPGHPARVAVYPGCGRCMPVICANARPDAETQKAPSCCAPYPGRIETTEVVPWGTHEERASCARIVSTGQGVDKSHFSGTG